jgi:hypothetical protein
MSLPETGRITGADLAQNSSWNCADITGVGGQSSILNCPSETTFAPFHLVEMQPLSPELWQDNDFRNQYVSSGFPQRIKVGTTAAFLNNS